MQLSYPKARAKLRSLSEYDPETVGELTVFMDSRERGPADWANATTKDHDIKSANRAIEAQALAQIVEEDLQKANARIAFLEGQNADIKTLLFDLMDQVDLLNRGCSHPKTSN